MPVIYPNLLTGVYTVLREVFLDGKQADRAIERVLKSNPKWGGRDRRFIASHSYDCIRHWTLLWYLAGENPSFTDAALLKVSVVKWLLFNEENNFTSGLNAEKEKIQSAFNNITDPAIRFSFPVWLVEKFKQSLPSSWERELEKLNTTADLVLRTNTLKITRAELIRRFKEEENSTAVPLESNSSGLILSERRNIFISPLFKNGYFEVQDGASQEVVAALDPQPGETVIDACAGGGGKSLHAAALMNNKGRIIAMDTETWKLDELHKRAKRNGTDIIRMKPIESTKTIKRLYDTADRVLLDVPCSGSGTLRRNPDLKWKSSETKLTEVGEKQKEILFRYPRMAKPGGIVVYSTCSLFNEENGQRVNEFINSRQGEFELLSEQTLTPSGFGFDGFYIAVMRRIR